MFESMTEREARGTRRQSAWISTAAVAHGGVLFLIVAASLLARVEAGTDPPEPMPRFQPDKSIIDVKLGDRPDAGPARKTEKPVDHEKTRPSEPKRAAPVVPPSLDRSSASTKDAPPAPPIVANLLTGAEDIGDDGRPGDGDGTGPGPPGTSGLPWGRIGGERVEGEPGLSGDDPPESGRPEAYQVDPARLLTRVEPDYPEVDRRSHVEGTVILEALVGPSGRVEAIRVLTASTPRMEDAAVRAVQRWRYRPARQNSRAIGVYVMIHIRFELR